jgi:hypothetical protein
LLLHDGASFWWIDVCLLLIPSRARTFRIGIRTCRGHGPFTLYYFGALNSAGTTACSYWAFRAICHGIQDSRICRPKRARTIYPSFVRVPCLAFVRSDPGTIAVCLALGRGRSSGDGCWHLRVTRGMVCVCARARGGRRGNGRG